MASKFNVLNITKSLPKSNISGEGNTKSSFFAAKLKKPSWNLPSRTTPPSTPNNSADSSTSTNLADPSLLLNKFGSFLKMNYQIWSFFGQILCNRNDLIGIIKPFMENLNKENINDKKYIEFLKTFSKYQLEVFLKYEIISAEQYQSLTAKKIIIQPSKYIMNRAVKPPATSSTVNKPSIGNKTNSISNENLKMVEEIIAEDKIIEFQNFIQENDIKTFNIIRKPFKEVYQMKIPLIEYCIMENAIECFKYLLVNGFDDPNRIMEENNRESKTQTWETEYRYEWDCMALAIYLGKKEIIKILEDKEVEKGNIAHIEAAIFSYRNVIVEEILEEMNEKNDDLLIKGLSASSKSNNIKGAELLIAKGVNINKTDKLLNSIKKTELQFITQQKKIQKNYSKFYFQKEQQLI